MARGTRYQPEQVVNLLRQIEVAVANGKTTAQACKEAEIVEQTYFRWRKEYGGLQVDVLLTLILTFGLATAATAQSAPAPNLELRLRPGALVDGVPDSFTFEIVSISKHDVRVPQPTVDSGDSYSGFIWLRRQFKPLHPNAKSDTGFGCAADKVHWPSILERAHEWRLLRPGGIRQPDSRKPSCIAKAESQARRVLGRLHPALCWSGRSEGASQRRDRLCSGSALHTSPNFHEAAMSGIVHLGPGSASLPSIFTAAGAAWAKAGGRRKRPWTA
jgi:hypothetical protein